MLKVQARISFQIKLQCLVYVLVELHKVEVTFKLLIHTVFIKRCVSCEQIFQKNPELQKHIRENHMSDDELYQTCYLCNKRFSKSYMAEHIKSHSNVFRCKICLKTFSCGSNLRKHVKKHNPGYKPKKQSWINKRIKCDQCDRLLRGTNSMKVSCYFLLTPMTENI